MQLCNTAACLHNAIINNMPCSIRKAHTTFVISRFRAINIQAQWRAATTPSSTRSIMVNDCTYLLTERYGSRHLMYITRLFA